MPDEDLHLADQTRSQAHEARPLRPHSIACGCRPRFDRLLASGR